MVSLQLDNVEGPWWDRLAPKKSVLVKITGGPATPEVKLMPKHKKNAEVGEKKAVYSSVIIILQEDAESFNCEANEEVKFWYWITIQQCTHIINNR